MLTNFVLQTVVQREFAMEILGDLWLLRLTQESGRSGVSPPMEEKTAVGARSGQLSSRKYMVSWTGWRKSQGGPVREIKLTLCVCVSVCASVSNLPNYALFCDFA